MGGGVPEAKSKGPARRGHSVLTKAALRLCRSGTKNSVLDLGTWTLVREVSVEVEPEPEGGLISK